MTPIISTDRLTKQYRPPHGPTAVREITLAVEEGEILSLLGRNGAGKTTLIGLLCGLFPPTSGHALIAGHSIAGEPMAIKRVVGVVPQEIALYLQLSGRQNLLYFGQLYGLGGQALERAVAGVLAVIEMSDLADQKVGRLSNGMKRRLNIAVALLHRPPLLLMDEPTVGLDPDSRRRILDLIMRLKREQGVTVLYATHHMAEAQEISDRVAIMHEGRIIALGSPAALIRDIHAPETLCMHVAGDSPPAGLLDALRQMANVQQVSQHYGNVTMSLVNTSRVLPDILRTAEQLGADIQTLTVAQPSLEAVFLRLTGENLEVTP